jgi:hypothetical protein
MTAFDPIHYEISIIDRDKFHRPITYGLCNYTLGDHLEYFVPLITLNIGMLCLAVYQSWQTRNLSTEFQESEQVSRALFSILLVSFIGMPVLFLAKHEKDAALFIGSGIIFVTCVSILGQLFIPKLRYEKNRRSSINKNGQWAATAAVAEITEVVDHVDARSQIGEIILSTKTRIELIIENDNLRKQILLMNADPNNNEPSIPTMNNDFESTSLQIIRNETSGSFPMGRSTINAASDGGENSSRKLDSI